MICQLFMNQPHPSPDRVNVQMQPSLMRAALLSLKRDWQSEFVKVVSAINCKLSAADPPVTVRPQPEATTLTPPPTNADPSSAGATFELKTTSVEVSTTEISSRSDELL